MLGFSISKILCKLKSESIDYGLNPTKQKNDMVEYNILVSYLLRSYCRTLKALCFQTLGPPKQAFPMNNTDAPIAKRANPFSTKFIDIFIRLI